MVNGDAALALTGCHKEKLQKTKDITDPFSGQIEAGGPAIN